MTNVEPFDEWEQLHLIQFLEWYKPPTEPVPVFSTESESVVEMGQSCDVPGATCSGTGFEGLRVELEIGDDHFNEFQW